MPLNFAICVCFADILRTIRDPEKPNTLEDLNVVYEEGVFVQDPTSDNVQVVSGSIIIMVVLIEIEQTSMFNFNRLTSCYSQK